MRQIAPAELKQRLDAGEPTYLLDVRHRWEYETVALPGSVLIPLGELPTHLDEVEPPAGALVVAYCHHGVRSLSACVILEQAGFTEVASLSGGIDAWSQLIDPTLKRY